MSNHINCDIDNIWGIPGVSSPLRVGIGSINAIPFLGGPDGAIIRGTHENIARITGHDVEEVYLLSYETSAVQFEYQGAPVSSSNQYSNIPNEIFDDYYQELSGITFRYSRTEDGFLVFSNFTISLESTVKIRTILDFYNVFVAAGFTEIEMVENIHSIDRNVINPEDIVPSSIRCINLEGSDTVIRIQGNPVTDMSVTTTIIDGDPPLEGYATEEYVDDAIQVIRDELSTQNQALYNENQALKRAVQYFIDTYGVPGD